MVFFSSEYFHLVPKGSENPCCTNRLLSVLYKPYHFSQNLSRFFGSNIRSKLKADRQHPHDYPHMPTNYKHADKHLRLVMILIALCCTQQSRAPNIDQCTPENCPWQVTFWPRPLILSLKQGNSDVKIPFLAFDLDLELRPWHTIPS